MSDISRVPEKKAIIKFRTKLLRWFRKNGRSYPWRETDDPFRLLVAELMLRRTKAEQVKPVYEAFFKKFSDVRAVAVAGEDDIEEALFSLGLSWRFPAFKLVAKELIARYNGLVPASREELKTLPGVGDYVSGAVLSVGFKKKEWIMDSNTVRLFKRYFGLETSKEGRRDKHLIETAKMYVSCRAPDRANLAILDFSAMVCKPLKPDCCICILRHDCVYVANV